MAAFDAALAGIAVQRPLPAAVAELLELALLAAGAEHGYVRVGTKDGAPPQAQAGRGMWAFDLPEDVIETVIRSGRVHVASSPTEGRIVRCLAVPVVVEGEVVGSLGVAADAAPADRHGGSGPAPVPDGRRSEADVLERFARLVAIVYAGARVITTERSARDQEKALIRSGRALSSTLELQGVLNRILTELRYVVPYDTASVQELRGDQMVIVGGNGIDMEVFGGVGFDVTGDGVPNAEVLRSRAPVIVPDILGDHPYHDFPHDAHEMSGVRGWLGVPLLFADECTGMLTLDTFEPDFYTDDHADTALAFASQAAIALQNARSFAVARREVDERRRAEADLRRTNGLLRERMADIEALQADLREQAVRDALTGLFNRRYLMEALHEEVERAGAEGRPLALALIDVDHFKQVNDTCGHAVGDLVLKEVAAQLAARTREGEVACRYGGEEFVVLMPGVGREEAHARAEGWRASMASVAAAAAAPAVDGAAVAHGAPDADAADVDAADIDAADVDVPSSGRLGGAAGSIDSLGVTASIGVAVLDHAAEGRADDGDALIRRADAAMYAAKARGRDRVVCSWEVRAPAAGVQGDV